MKRGLRKRGSLILASAVLVAILVGGSAPALGQQAPAAGKNVLRVGWMGDVESLNPFVAWSVESYEAFRLVYSLLTTWGPDLESVADLARSWESSADGLTWTFHLAANAKWSDGQPVTSADVAFTFRYVIDNQMDTFLDYVSSIESIDTPDPTTVVLHLSEPAAFMPQIYVWILPEHIWKDVPPEEAAGEYANSNPVGCGPFVLAEQKPGEYIRFRANPGYFGGRPAIDEVVYVHYADDVSLIEALKAGDIDVVARVPETQFEGLKNLPNIVTLKSSGNGFTELAFNCWTDPVSKGNPVLLDPKFRRAVAQAIDKQKIVDTISSGLAEPGDSVIPPVLGDYHWSPGPGVAIVFNPEAAKTSLERAGYSDANGDGWREDKQGRPLSLRFYLRSESEADSETGEMIAEWLADVGLKTELEAMDDETLSAHIYDSGDFDMFVWGWGGDVDPSFLLSIFTTDQIMNWSDCLYSNPAYDAKFEEQQHVLFREARVAMVQRCQEILYEDCPYVVLSYDPDLQAYRTDRFTGWVETPEGGNVIMTFSPATYLALQPAGAAGGGGGSGLTALWVGLGVVAVAAAAVVAVLITRARQRRRAYYRG